MPIPLMLIESMVLASVPIVVMSLPIMAVLFLDFQVDTTLQTSDVLRHLSLQS
ncbi:hypothetical protein KSF_011780 [Reticulibacter mediterranei]|uniref:Uncharacterized protein n=1 Tax=Reticulibacter mediterranei TaxID=2778369 RepID=A0A8J3IEP8_9CHLR|nr:hypothetical protein [Reticulibacter mediterranei]GHO91130.1 hypothetical protein KSF_011780 [Reticulibacter mediterranei]